MQYLIFLALASVFSQASILSDKQECKFSSHAHSAFDATDRSYANICVDAVVKSTLPSCHTADAGSKKSRVHQKKSSKGVQ